MLLNDCTAESAPKATWAEAPRYESPERVTEESKLPFCEGTGATAASALKAASAFPMAVASLGCSELPSCTATMASVARMRSCSAASLDKDPCVDYSWYCATVGIIAMISREFSGVHSVARGKNKESFSSSDDSSTRPFPKPAT